MSKEVKFEEYQDKCPWKQDRWCSPLNRNAADRVKCESSECPFWCLRNIDRKEKE
jgi:hypothetical protein